MRKLFSVAAFVLVAVLAACQSAPAANDPYQVLYDSRDATWEQVQVQVGLSVQGGDTPISIDSSAIKLVLDTKAGKALVHLSLPVAQLGVDPATLIQLGITGPSLDVDVLWDGDALYAKSPAAGPIVTMLMLQSGEVPTGDLAGWLKLGTAADFGAIPGLAGGGVIPSTAPMATPANAAALKTELEAAGITLTLAGSEQHAGVDANHVTVAVDWAKLAASPMFASVTQSQLESFLGAIEEATITADIWADKSSKRIVGVDAHLASTDGSNQKVDLTITLKTPDAGTSFDAPASAVEVPLMQMITQLLGSFGGL
jgi:hypothetical protein